MPYRLCPQCGTMSHLNVGDVKQWYEQYHPGLAVGSVVPILCFHCFQELKQGDRVVIRNPLQPHTRALSGRNGTLAGLLRSKDGVLYAVKLDEGEEAILVRSELRPLSQQEKRAEDNGWNDERVSASG
jgi:phage terminase large subunit GpA-like protein